MFKWGSNYDYPVIAELPFADKSRAMAIHTVNNCTDDAHADEPLGVITRAELEEARRDPKVLALHDEADRYLAELEREGLSR